jgi:transcription elongation factor Elf1
MEITTLLEFVLVKLIGPPYRTIGNGESYWNCPQCDSDSFHTMPDKPEEFKHRAKCWSCGDSCRGDAIDMVRIVLPEKTWKEARVMVENFRKEFEVLRFFSSGAGPIEIKQRNEHHHQHKALVDLMKLFEKQETADAFGFQIIGQATEICEKHGVSLAEVYKDWKRYQISKVWWADIEARVEAVMKTRRQIPEEMISTGPRWG